MSLSFCYESDRLGDVSRVVSESLASLFSHLDAYERSRPVDRDTQHKSEPYRAEYSYQVLYRSLRCLCRDVTMPSLFRQHPPMKSVLQRFIPDLLNVLHQEHREEVRWYSSLPLSDKLAEKPYISSAWGKRILPERYHSFLHDLLCGMKRTLAMVLLHDQLCRLREIGRIQWKQMQSRQSDVVQDWNAFPFSSPHGSAASGFPMPTSLLYRVCQDPDMMRLVLSFLISPSMFRTCFAHPRSRDESNLYFGCHREALHFHVSRLPMSSLILLGRIAFHCHIFGDTSVYIQHGPFLFYEAYRDLFVSACQPRFRAWRVSGRRDHCENRFVKHDRDATRHLLRLEDWVLQLDRDSNSPIPIRVGRWWDQQGLPGGAIHERVSSRHASHPPSSPSRTRGTYHRGAGSDRTGSWTLPFTPFIEARVGMSVRFHTCLCLRQTARETMCEEEDVYEKQVDSDSLEDANPGPCRTVPKEVEHLSRYRDTGCFVWTNLAGTIAKLCMGSGEGGEASHIMVRSHLAPHDLFPIFSFACIEAVEPLRGL